VLVGIVHDLARARARANDMVNTGLLTFRDRTGKGGHHRIYQPAFETLGEAVSFLREKLKAMLDSELVLA